MNINMLLARDVKNLVQVLCFNIVYKMFLADERLFRLSRNQ